jgi:hypothetical protein
LLPCGLRLRRDPGRCRHGCPVERFIPDGFVGAGIDQPLQSRQGL